MTRQVVYCVTNIQACPHTRIWRTAHDKRFGLTRIYLLPIPSKSSKVAQHSMVTQIDFWNRGGLHLFAWVVSLTSALFLMTAYSCLLKEPIRICVRGASTSAHLLLVYHGHQVDPSGVRIALLVHAYPMPELIVEYSSNLRSCTEFLLCLTHPSFSATFALFEPCPHNPRHNLHEQLTPNPHC